jgi:hypothetical protein
MPVEIKELVIRAVVTPNTIEAGKKAVVPVAASMNTDAVIQECVNQVLRILKKKKER